MPASPKKPSSKKPTKLTRARKDKYLACLRRGVRRVKAARAVGLHYNTIYQAYQKDESFAREIDEAEMHAVDEVENALHLSCVKDRNTTAIIFYLQNRMPDRWQDRRNIALSGRIDSDLNVKLDEQIEQEIMMLRESVLAGTDDGGNGHHGSGNGRNGSNGNGKH